MQWVQFGPFVNGHPQMVRFRRMPRTNPQCLGSGPPWRCLGERNATRAHLKSGGFGRGCGWRRNAREEKQPRICPAIRFPKAKRLVAISVFRDASFAALLRGGGLADW
jgi:hypothetical protein